MTILERYGEIGQNSLGSLLAIPTEHLLELYQNYKMGNQILTTPKAPEDVRLGMIVGNINCLIKRTNIALDRQNGLVTQVEKKE